MFRIIAFITAIIIINSNIKAQQPLKIEPETKLCSFLKIGYGYLIDTKRNKRVLQISGAFGESKWYKLNDSLFRIDFYTSLPINSNRPTVRYKLKIFRDTFSLKRNKRYVGYPILNETTLMEIKTQAKKPCERILFQNKGSKKKQGVSKADCYINILGWTAIAIMNGKSEFIEIYNSLHDKNCCGAECNEAYYEIQYVLSLFEFEIYSDENHIQFLRKKY